MPTVSIIVPNYNHEPYLKQRIESIINQTYKDFELLLLDDCSTDNSRDIILSYQNHPKVARILFNEKNSGSAFKQWDKGIRIANGDLIWIAESDDWAEPEFLETIIKEFNKCSDAGLIYTASKLVNAEGEITYSDERNNSQEVIEYKGIDFISAKLLTSNAIGNASMMVFKKQLYFTIEDFGYVEMTYCGDWYLYAQLCQNAAVIEIKRSLNNYRIHRDNVSNKSKTEGKYFTEGFPVFVYLSKIKGIKVNYKNLYSWAKMYKKASKTFQFADSLRFEILKMFFSYNPLLLVFVLFRTILYYLKGK